MKALTIILRALLLSAACCLPLTPAALAQSARNPFLPPAPRAAAPSPSLTESPAAASTRIYSLSYARASDLLQAVRELLPGRLGTDAITNSLLYHGTQSEQQRLSELIRRLDIPTRQITLEAKIIAVSRERNQSLGVDWDWEPIPRRGAENSDGSGEDGGRHEGNFQFWRGYSFRFNATLNALISRGRARVLATPRIITVPGREASIFIGDHIPVQTEKHDNSGSYTATEYLDAGIKLQYTPLVSADGRMVTAAVHTEVSTPVLISELKNYRITSRTADTHVRMFSGETLAIGGLISEEEQSTLRKVPFLGDIPLLGELFKSRTKTRSSVEVLLLLTPHITEAGASPAIYSSLAQEGGAPR